MSITPEEEVELRKVAALAIDLLSRIRAGLIDPRNAADELGLGFDQDEIVALLGAAASPIGLLDELARLRAERDEAERLRADAELEVQLLAKGLKAEQSRLLKAVEVVRLVVDGADDISHYTTLEGDHVVRAFVLRKAREFLRSIEEASDA